jgi:hypothetical protein
VRHDLELLHQRAGCSWSRCSRGNPEQALRVYDDLRVVLRDALGASPAAETRDLAARLQR